MIKNNILHEVTSYYLTSGDFNGMPAAMLSKKLHVDWNDMLIPLQELIDSELIGVIYADIELNTHILRLGFPPKDVQISKLNTDELFHTCVYPRPNQLQKIVDISEYANQPYRLCLALGEPQLA